MAMELHLSVFVEFVEIEYLYTMLVFNVFYKISTAYRMQYYNLIYVILLEPQPLLSPLSKMGRS
jgi:hypothetical protein